MQRSIHKKKCPGGHTVMTSQLQTKISIFKEYFQSYLDKIRPRSKVHVVQSQGSQKLKVRQNRSQATSVAIAMPPSGNTFGNAAPW